MSAELHNNIKHIYTNHSEQQAIHFQQSYRKRVKKNQTEKTNVINKKRDQKLFKRPARFETDFHFCFEKQFKKKIKDTSEHQRILRQNFRIVCTIANVFMILQLANRIPRQEKISLVNENKKVIH